MHAGLKYTTRTHGPQGWPSAKPPMRVTEKVSLPLSMIPWTLYQTYIVEGCGDLLPTILDYWTPMLRKLFMGVLERVDHVIPKRRVVSNTPPI